MTTWRGTSRCDKPIFVNSTNKTPGGIAVGCLRTADFDDATLQKMALRCVKSLRRPGQSEERHSSYLGGRAVLARLLEKASVEGWVEPNPRFGYLQLSDSTGRDFTDRYVNVSHSSGFVAGVLAPTPVGIDVEAITRDASRVAERVSEPDEWKELPERVAVVGGVVPGSLAMWCAKEAVSKALGLGVVFGMKAFKIRFSSGNPALVELAVKGPLSLISPAVWLEIRAGHLFAICTEADHLAERISWNDESEVD